MGHSHRNVIKCAFGEQTESLIMDTFIQNVNNKMVQQKLCTEHQENPQDAFRYAVAYEEGISQHQTVASGRREIKNEPVYAVTERKNPCTRCRLEFTQNQLATCKAKNEKCRNCATKEHYARMCKRPKNVNRRGNFGEEQESCESTWLSEKTTNQQWAQNKMKITWFYTSVEKAVSHL